MSVFFSERELLELGFETVVDGEEWYLQFIFNPEDYINSKFLATESKDEIGYQIYGGVFRVINPNNDEGEEYLNKKQIKALIKAGGF